MNRNSTLVGLAIVGTSIIRRPFDGGLVICSSGVKLMALPSWANVLKTRLELRLESDKLVTEKNDKSLQSN